ncbi:MAG: AmmeMemoRadiSam system protein A [Planctomycetota bacterium]
MEPVRTSSFPRRGAIIAESLLRSEPSDKQWRTLLHYVAASVHELLERGAPPDAGSLVAVGLDVQAGCFVTWRRIAVDGQPQRPGAQLRGCIGAIDPAGRSLPSLAANMARSASLRDPRFPPVAAAELDGLRLSVTLLAAPVEWPAPRDPEELVLGRDGLEVQRGDQRGVLLPQVALEWGYDAAAFLGATCGKAKLPATAWQSPDTTVWRFAAWERGANYRDLRATAP